MSEYNIEKADFEEKKNQLKTFADQTSTSIKLDKFSTDGDFFDFLTGGIFGLMGHKVTGEEMNNLVTKLQTCFAEYNERDRALIKEFGQVYETFEALDKGYLQGILIGVKSAEKASAEAKAAQKDIDDTIKALQITISKLKEFKDEVKGYSHLKDIDDMWNDVFQLDRELKSLSKKVKEHSIGENVDKAISRISYTEEKLSSHEERMEFYERENSQLKKHMNFTYIIAGSALGISIIQIILLLIGIL